MTRNLLLLALALTIAMIGAVGGWMGAAQLGATAKIPAAESVPSNAAKALQLSPQTLKTLGVTTGVVTLQDFVDHVSVLAVIVDPPSNTQPLYAPVSGVVTSIRARQGTVVLAGEIMLTLTRDAIARPELKLTAEILAPVSENLHESVSRLRSATSHLKIAETELVRIRAFTETGTIDGLPILPRKAEIDVRYEVERGRQEVANARNELERHGLSPAEIEAVERGQPAPASQKLWKRALQRNALWNDITEAMLQTLPVAERELPWPVAAIGELAAAGLATRELLQVLKETPHISRHFVDAASLLLQGQTLANVRFLAEGCFLEPVVDVKAAQGPEDWDVASLAARVGQRVAAGEVLAVLHDARTMWLEVRPVGEEIASVVAALERRLPIAARPIIRSSGPDISNIHIDRMETRGEGDERGAHAYLSATNRPIAGIDADRQRSWHLRSGLRYAVAIPRQTLKARFVLPVGALADDGPDRVVFVADGDSFKKKVVHVEFADDRQVVIANDGSLFPGDPVVLSGAFQLGLALQASRGQGADAHAGHNH